MSGNKNFFNIYFRKQSKYLTVCFINQKKEYSDFVLFFSKLFTL